MRDRVPPPETHRPSTNSPELSEETRDMEEDEQGYTPNSGQMSVIGADIVVTGNIEASVDLNVEGKVIGDVRCATLILGESSSVNGHIYAARVKVSGTVDGALETRDLAVEANARVTGDITYERLRVANGGVVEGNLTCRISAANAVDKSKLKLVESQPPEEAAVSE